MCIRDSMEEEAHLYLLTPTHYLPPIVNHQKALRHGAESVSVIGSSTDIVGL